MYMVIMAYSKMISPRRGSFVMKALRDEEIYPLLLRLSTIIDQGHK